MNYWIVKQEPESYSWDDFVKEGGTSWTGVRNYTARNNLKAMEKGDRVFFYHSVSEKRIVGLAKVVETAFPDPTADQDGWVAVKLEPVKPLPRPVTLDEIKADKTFHDIALIRIGRLSVSPLTAKQGERMMQIGGVK
jgi:predicted RNA-binding protein with PUA-like domain